LSYQKKKNEYSFESFDYLMYGVWKETYVFKGHCNWKCRKI